MKFTNRKLMNTIFIAGLFCASVFSIGFSSWLICGGGGNPSADIDINVGNYDSSDNYVSKLTSTLDSKLTYCGEGFVSTGKEVTNTLNLNLYFYFKPKLYKDITNGVIPTFKFSYDLSDFISHANFTLNSIYFCYSSSNQTLMNDSNNSFELESSVYNKDNYLSSFSESNATFYFSFTFSYSGSAFNSDIYSQIKNGSTTIVFQIGMVL